MYCVIATTKNVLYSNTIVYGPYSSMREAAEAQDRILNDLGGNVMSRLLKETFVVSIKKMVAF